MCATEQEPPTPTPTGSHGSGQLSQVCQGSTPHPPLKFPLLSHCTNRTRTTLRGGECDERPESHQRRPGNRRGTPARTRHRLIGHTCGSLWSGYISPADPAYRENLLHENETNPPSLSLSQTAACDRAAHHEAQPGLRRTGSWRKRALTTPEHPCEPHCPSLSPLYK